MTLEYILNNYKTERYKISVQQKGADYSSWVVFPTYLEYFENYLGFYSTLNDLDILVNYAVKGLFSYKEKEYVHPHQAVFRDRGGNDRGIKPEVSKEVINNIMEQEEELSAAIKSNDFDVLYDFIKKNKAGKFGVLDVYDTALRIGSKYNITPKNVYLHGSGTIAIRTLETKRLIEEDLSAKKYIALKDLPECLQNMNPIYIEDFLNLKRMDFMRI